MEIGAPVVCSDLVNLSFKGIEDMISDPRISIAPAGSLNISGILRIYSSGTDRDAFNVIVERDRLDKELASRAILSGSRMTIRSEFKGMEETPDIVQSVYRRGGKNYAVRSKYVVMSTGAFPVKSEDYRLAEYSTLNYAYSRKIAKSPPELTMEWVPQYGIRYKVPRLGHEFNEVDIWEKSDLEGKDDPVSTGSSPPASIIFGSTSVKLPRTPIPGSARILNVGTHAGLYDPFFLTGFREALISGELLALSLIKNFDNPSLVTLSYGDNLKKRITESMEKGFRLRSAMNRTGKENVNKFLEYLSGFNFSEISADEIFKVASITDPVLDEMLPEAY